MLWSAYKFGIRLWTNAENSGNGHTQFRPIILLLLVPSSNRAHIPLPAYKHVCYWNWDLLRLKLRSYRTKAAGAENQNCAAALVDMSSACWSLCLEIVISQPNNFPTAFRHAMLLFSQIKRRRYKRSCSRAVKSILVLHCASTKFTSSLFKCDRIRGAKLGPMGWHWTKTKRFCYETMTLICLLYLLQTKHTTLAPLKCIYPNAGQQECSLTKQKQSERI